MKTKFQSIRKRLIAVALALVTVFGAICIAVPAQVEAAVVQTSAAATASVSTSGQFYIVTAKTAKLRNSTGLFAGTYATLNQGAVIQVTGTSGNHYKVSVNGTTYYIKKSEVAKASSSTGGVRYYTTKSAPLRKGPYEEAGKVTTFAKGEVITVVGTLKNKHSNTWLIVYYSGKLYYMYSGNAAKTGKITLKINGSASSVGVGKTLTLKATTSPAGLKVTWFTSNSAIATVDANGKVRGVMPGNVVITAKVGNVVTASYKLSVDLKLNVTRVKQTTSYTCSAAASLAVLRYKGKAASTSDTTLYKSTDGYVYKIVNVLNSYLGSGTYRYNTFTSKSAYEKAIVNSLKQGCPVIARVAFAKEYFNYKSGGHYTTITGIEYDSNGTAWLLLVDSYAHNYKSNTYTDASAGTVRVPLSVLYQYGTYSGKSAIYLIYND